MSTVLGLFSGSFPASEQAGTASADVPAAAAIDINLKVSFPVIFFVS